MTITESNGAFTFSATNTASAVDNILDGSNSGTAITYAPYASNTATSTWVGNNTNAGKLYLGTVNPSKTTRLNYNGYLYGTKLYSGGSEVLTSHQTIYNLTLKGAGTAVTTFDPNSAANSLDIVAGSNVTVTGDTTNKKITIAATDTTYSSKTAAKNGTDVSLVTTGEKYT